MRKYISFAALSVLAVPVFASMAMAQATLSVDPTIQTTSTGSVVIVDIDVAHVSDLYGYQFDLTFNPSIFQAVSSSEGSFLASGGSTYFIPGTDDNVGGTVAATADTLLTATNGVSGSGELAVFTFDVIGKGSSSLAIQNVTLLNSNLNVIAETATSGSITVTSGAAAAPEIDLNSAASGLLLLIGGLAVINGSRRRTQVPNN